MSDPALEGAAHIVQLALTPVFLLSGVAALVNVFSTRLGRVSDQADALARQGGEGRNHHLRLELLRWRSRSLDCAVMLAAVAGACTCGAALALFLGAVRGSAGASLLFWLFGGGLVLTVAALFAFVLEMLLAARGVRHLLDLSAATHKRKHRAGGEDADLETGEASGGDHGGTGAAHATTAAP